MTALKGSSNPSPALAGLDRGPRRQQSSNVLASVLTDNQQQLWFPPVSVAAVIEVAEVVQTNWVQTQPLFPTNYSFTAKSGLILSAVVFGDHASPALSPVAVIDNGQPGYAETGSWSTVSGGFNGTNRAAHTTVGAQPTATAEWSFTGLAPASYQVFVTFAGKPNYATAAPFTVLDGGTTLGTATLNESILVTQSQGGLAQGSYGGVGWLELGVFTSADGNLEVLLSNKTPSGSFVDADGVLLVANPAPGIGRHGIVPPSAGGTEVAGGTLEQEASDRPLVPRSRPEIMAKPLRRPPCSARHGDPTRRT